MTPRFWRNPFVADPDAVGRRRRAAQGPRAEYLASRRDAMKTLYRDGATLEEVGALYGITRERARQVIAGEVKRFTGLEPIKTITVCRRSRALYLAAQELGHDAKEITVLLKATGYWPAMSRLWAWRKRNERPGKFTDQELITKLRALAEKLGHTPGMLEAGADPDTPAHTTYVRRWGNWAPACAAAGLKPGARGIRNRPLSPNCPRGHLFTPENTYTWRGNRACRECGRIRSRSEYQAKKAKAAA